MDSKKKTGYLVPHTHWDREWRYPLWKTRVLLVELIDSLLDILDNDPSYKCFVMDGQSVPVEDYLQIRPEMREKITRYVGEGRIAIGPWYTLPDLYPLDGECLIRNLLKGIRFCKELGGYQNVGYNSFGWGQTAQFPQIYQGFGIDTAIAAKRISKERAPDSEFMWEAPDGTRMLTTRLGEGVRHSFFMNAYVGIVNGLPWPDQETGFDWSKAGLMFHRADAAISQRDHFKLAGEGEYYPEFIKEGFEKAWAATDETLMKDHRLFLAGCDFTSAMPRLTRIINDADKVFEDRQFVHGTLEEYVLRLKESVDEKKLKVVKGEMRDGPAEAASANALATRAYLKALNKKAQNALIYTAEPLASAATAALGAEYPLTFFETAWNYLLKAHPHDSINGVTQDRTAEDTEYRINQAIEIADAVLESTIGQFLKAIDLRRFDSKDILLVIFNPTGRKRRDVIKVALDIPREYNLWDFSIEDCHGNEIDIQHLARKEELVPVHDPDARPWAFKVDRHAFFMDTGELPAGGYKVYRLVPGALFDRSAVNWPPTRMSDGETLLKSGNTMENEYLRVSLNDNGTFNLTDRVTGKEFQDLHYFEDTGDVGDYWITYPPYQNRTYTSRNIVARTWVEEAGALSTTIGIETRMLLPAHADRPESGVSGDSRRSSDEKILTAVTRITLKRGYRRLDIKTTVENTVEDHRFRVLFPTGIQAKHSSAAGHFTVDKQPVIPQKDANGMFYPEMQTLPQQTFVDISDGKTGLAFINNCLCEFEAMNDEERTLALTLFRSVRNGICTGMCCQAVFPDQKGGQMLGTHEFEYSIYSHSGDWEQANVYDEALNFNIPILAIQTRRHEHGSLPLELSLYELDSDKLVMTAFKKAEDRNSFILRCFNPSSEQAEGVIRTHAEVNRAYLTNLNEERQSEMPVTRGHEVAITAGGNKIVTVELEF